MHLDGYNLLSFLTGEVKKSPRVEYFYFYDDGDLMALRYDNWKLIFMEQRMVGTLRIWQEPWCRCAFRSFSPADRPLRAGRHHLEHLLGLDSRSRLPVSAGAESCGGIPDDVQGVPPAPEGGELHHRPGVAEAPGGGRQPLTCRATGKPPPQITALRESAEAVRTRPQAKLS